MADDDTFKLDFDKVLVEQNGGWAGGTLDWIGAFGRSAVESIPELVGITPSDETVRWRSANPWSGFTSELAGMAVPYGGWLRAARGIKALEAAATGVRAADVGTDVGRAAWDAKVLASPFMSGARAEAVRLAPFEVGRVLANEVVGDKSLGEMAVSAGLNLGLGAGVAGGFSKLGAMGKVAPALGTLVPGLDDALPPQLILRELDKVPDPAIASRVPDIELRARNETAPKGTRHTALGDDLERLFQSGVQDSGRTQKKRLVTGDKPDEFFNDGDWMDAVRAAGVEPQQAARLMQFPRVIRFDPSKELELIADMGLDIKPTLKHTTDAAKRIEGDFTKALAPVGDGWLMAQEAENGMFVMARKIAGDMPGEIPAKASYAVSFREGRGKTQHRRFASEENFAKWAQTRPKAKVVRAEWVEGKPRLQSYADANDQWLLFKTDQPAQFVKNSQGMLNTQVAREKWIVGSTALEKYSQGQGPVSAALGLQSMFPKVQFKDAVAAAGDPGRLTAFWQKHGPKALKGNQATQHGSEVIRKYVTPADKQMRKSADGAWIMNQGRMIGETIDTWYQKLLQGELSFSGPRASFVKIVQTPGSARSVSNVLDDMEKEGVVEEFIKKVYRPGVPAEGLDTLVAEGRIKPETAALAKELRGMRISEHGEFNKAEELVGAKLSKLDEADYGLPRAWSGDFMQVVREEGGAIAGVAAGGSAKAAAKQAEALAKQLGAEVGRPYKVGEAFTRTQDMTGLPADIKLFAQNPGGMLANKRIRGFKWDLETPTAGELMDEYNRAFTGRGRVMASNIREASLAQHLGTLTTNDPKTAQIIAGRFNQMAGGEGEFGKIQNKVVDAVLAPVLGPNSASKIVAATNTGMVHLQLGAGKLSYPLQNVVGVVQTVMPELAFVMNATEEASKKYGMTVPAVGSRGIVGSMSTLAPMKTFAQAVRMMYKPTADERAAWEWALNNRVLGSRVGEEYIGQNRRTLGNWKGALTSPRAFGEFALALSEWLPVHSEQFARAISFAAGYRVFRDWARVTDPDQLLLLAKRFTERTNYLYASSDRPLVFTTPLGSSLGLFKNWQMNYIHTMAEYANLGVNKGTWSPLMWQTLGTAATGGAAATPVYWLANGASKFLADKSLVQYAYDEWGEDGDALMFGLPAALTGVSLSGLVTSPGANPVKDATQLFSLASWTRAKEAGGAVSAAMDNWRATGQHPASDPDVRNALIKAFAPVLMQRAMSIDEEGTIRNIATGLPSAKGLSFYDRMMYQAGLNPTIVERQAAASDALYHDKEKMKTMTKAFGDSMAEALEAGDSRAADVITQRAIASGVPVANVFQSASARMRAGTKTSAERMARPATVKAWENVLGY